MTLKRQTFDSGPQGSTITVASSANDGDQLNAATLTNNGIAQYEVAAAIHGPKGAHVLGNASDTAILELLNTTATSGTCQVYFKLLAIPSTGGSILQIQTLARVTVCSVSILASGVLIVQNTSFSTLKSFLSSTPLTLNKVYRLQLQATPDTTSTGTIQAQLYDETDALLDSYASSSVNAGTDTNVRYVRVGKLATASDGFNLYIDDLAFDTGTMAQIATLSPLNRQNSAEGGTDGVAATLGNSGGTSGDALVMTPNSGSITYSSAVVHTGKLSYCVAPFTGSSSKIGWGALSKPQFSGRCYVYLTGNPSTATQLMDMGNVSSAATITINGSGIPVIQDGSGTANTGSTPLPLNTWLRLELTAIVGASTSTGTITAKIYSGDTTTSPLYSYTSSARNTTTSPLTYLNVGKCSGSGSWATMYFDDIALTEFATPVPVNTASISWLRA